MRLALLSSSRRAPSGEARTTTTQLDGGGGPTGPPISDQEPHAVPWGEAGVVSTRVRNRPGDLSSPNPTADLAGACREDRSGTYEWTASQAHPIGINVAQDRLHRRSHRRQRPRPEPARRPRPPTANGTRSPIANPAATGRSTPATAIRADCSSRRAPGLRTAAADYAPAANMATRERADRGRRAGAGADRAAARGRCAAPGCRPPHPATWRHPRPTPRNRSMTMQPSATDRHQSMPRRPTRLSSTTSRCRSRRHRPRGPAPSCSTRPDQSMTRPPPSPRQRASRPSSSRPPSRFRWRLPSTWPTRTACRRRAPTTSYLQHLLTAIRNQDVTLNDAMASG